MPPKKQPTVVEPLKDLPKELSVSKNNKVRKNVEFSEPELVESPQEVKHSVPHIIQPLTVNYEHLEWSDYGFNYPNMIRVFTIGDGSCFFHALLNAFYTPYRTRKLNGLPVTPKELVRDLRSALSARLGEPISAYSSPEDTYYSRLGDGTIAKIAETIPRYSLSEMQNKLADTTQYVGNEYNEFISDQLNKDIYILDGKTQDIYMTGDNWEKLYKNRDSIVLLYLPGHYELVSIIENGTTHSLFKYDNPFIQAIRSRMIEMCQT